LDHGPDPGAGSTAGSTGAGVAGGAGAATGGPQRSLRLLTVVLAFACGLSVANLYYAQPLLVLIARELHTGQGSAALIVTMTQLGYAAGLVLLLPLGDLLENRALASRTLVGTAAALVVAAVAPNIGLLLVVSVLIGLTSVVAQILVPLAAHFAPADQRGRVVGRVMSGLLLGILLARTVASLVAAHWGWRSVYLISAVLMLAVSVVLVRVLPRRRPAPGVRYPQLMASVGRLVRDEPTLRRRAICQALMFAAFSSFWTSIGYQLFDAHHLSQTGIGIFALVGAAGAASAPLAGWLGDRGHGRAGSGVVLALGVAAMAVAGAGRGSVVLLAAGAVLLDLAVQGHQVFSQQEIYQLRPDARARVNSVFMGTIFIAGAIASAVSGALYQSSGWTAVTVFGGVLPLVGLLVWVVSMVRAHRRPALAG
jgi:predicted MFS family arabinose efflux permease